MKLDLRFDKALNGPSARLASSCVLRSSCHALLVNLRSRCAHAHLPLHVLMFEMNGPTRIAAARNLMHTRLGSGESMLVHFETGPATMWCCRAGSTIRMASQDGELKEPNPVHTRADEQEHVPAQAQTWVPQQQHEQLQQFRQIQLQLQQREQLIHLQQLLQLQGPLALQPYSLFLAGAVAGNQGDGAGIGLVPNPAPYNVFGPGLGGAFAFAADQVQSPWRRASSFTTLTLRSCVRSLTCLRSLMWFRACR